MSEMVERVTAALAVVVSKTAGCHSERCSCYGVEAFECRTGIDVKDMARVAIREIGGILSGSHNSSLAYAGDDLIAELNASIAELNASSAE